MSQVKLDAALSALQLTANSQQPTAVPTLLSSRSAWTNASDCSTHELTHEKSTDIYDKDMKPDNIHFGMICVL